MNEPTVTENKFDEVSYLSDKIKSQIEMAQLEFKETILLASMGQPQQLTIQVVVNLNDNAVRDLHIYRIPLAIDSV